MIRLMTFQNQSSQIDIRYSLFGCSIFPWLIPMYVHLNHNSKTNHYKSKIDIRNSFFCGSLFPWLIPMYVHLNHNLKTNHYKSKIDIRYSLFCGSIFNIPCFCLMSLIKENSHLITLIDFGHLTLDLGR